MLCVKKNYKVNVSCGTVGYLTQHSFRLFTFTQIFLEISTLQVLHIAVNFVAQQCQFNRTFLCSQACKVEILDLRRHDHILRNIEKYIAVFVLHCEESCNMSDQKSLLSQSVWFAESHQDTA